MESFGKRYKPHHDTLLLFHYPLHHFPKGCYGKYSLPHWFLVLHLPGRQAFVFKKYFS